MPEYIPVSVTRLLSLVAWIGEHPGITVDELAQHFNRKKRQIMRDIEAIGSVGDSLPGSSFEIDWDLYEREGALRLESTMGVNLPVRLTEAEASAILVGLAALEPSLDEDLRQRVPRTALAVKTLVGQGEDSAFIVHGDLAAPKLLDELARAINKRRVISFSYTDAQGATSHRVVEPWELRFESGSWMVHGWCRHAQAHRTFAVARIHDFHYEKGHVRLRSCSDTVSGRTETIRLDPSYQWVGEDFDAVNARRDGEDLVVDVRVWDDHWFESLLIDLAPGIKEGPAASLERAGMRARKILQIWGDMGALEEEGS